MATIDKQTIDAQVREKMPFSHRWHNRFHLEMPFGLINDPNGLVCADGEYHIFFQWNPLGCVHKNKSWGHTKTRDFINYSMPELAMWPSDAHDKDGCYSGCGFTDESGVRVFYTCNAKDEQGVRTPAQRLGTWENGRIRKDEIAVPTNAEGFSEHYRDPYVFSRHGQKYFILGAQTTEKRGCVVIYRQDGDDWLLLGELKTELSAGGKNFGYMWECPGLLQFGDCDVLLCCPQGLPAEEYRYQNLYQSGYVTGHMSLDSMEFYHGAFRELDQGFDFYAPQVFNCTGRHILLGWMGMPDKDEAYPTRDEGWIFSLTMPRVLTLKQGRIYSEPIEELQGLRQRETDIDVAGVSDTTIKLSSADEIELDVEFGKARAIKLELCYGDEKTVFCYHRNTQIMEIDRNGMKLGGRGTRRFKLYADNELHLHIFVDRTAVEAFFQHGEEVASMLIFPEKDVQPELKITSDAPWNNLSGHRWELDGYKFH